MKNMAQASFESRIAEFESAIYIAQHNYDKLKHQTSDYARQHVALICAYRDVVTVLEKALEEENEHTQRLKEAKKGNAHD